MDSVLAATQTVQKNKDFHLRHQQKMITVSQSLNIHYVEDINNYKQELCGC